MAGDWIKMRVWLSRDPCVIAMADFLAGERSFMNWLTDPVQQSCRECAYEHVTRNVTVALCVTGLLVTWGTARERGDRDGDDLVLAHADFVTLDAMTDLPSFGEAMGHVGWAVEEENDSIRFPKFFKDNESPDDKHRRQAAERQAKFRAAKSNDEVTPARNVTVTHREEKRREVKTLAPDGAFERFWSAYPKKRSKDQALKAFTKLNPDEQLLAVMLAAIERAKTRDDWRKNKGQYIPYPGSWLSAGGWKDEDVALVPAEKRVAI